MEQHRPDAIISTFPEVLRWLKQAGFAVPEDVGFVATSVGAEFFDGPVSGIDELPEQIGAAAVDVLIGRIYRNEIGIPDTPRIVMLEGKWTGDHTIRRQ